MSVLIVQLWLHVSYQLVQSVLKIGFLLAKRWDSERWAGHSHDIPCTWQLSWLAIEKHWLAIEKPWLVLAGPFLSFLT